MKNLYIIFIAISLLSCAKKDKFSNLSGPYLGQKPPTMEPELFAPGIVSTGYSERIAAFTPDGKELFYVLTGAPHSVILTTKEENGKWTKPVIASFSGKKSAEFNMSPDGNKILFVYKPHGNDDPVWIVERNDCFWSEPTKLPAFINGYPTIASNGNIYFNRLNEKNNSWDVYLSEFVGGEYIEPINLGNKVNNGFHEADPFIAPDESYLLFGRIDTTSFGGADLYISFRDEQGVWSESKNMGEKINSQWHEYCPTVSPDGKYLFFLSFRKTYHTQSETAITLEEKMQILNSPGNGNGDIYWVDAKVIDDLKP